jgi:hypothetical protein
MKTWLKCWPRTPGASQSNPPHQGNLLRGAALEKGFLEGIEIPSNTVGRTICLSDGITKHLVARLAARAERCAIIASLIQTAEPNEIEPLADRRDVLKRIVSGRTKARELRPILQDASPYLRRFY